VTSSQPVTGKALFFTPDNKRAYAYSGTISFNNDETNILDFNTDSYYLIAKVQLGVDGYDGDDLDVGIKLNDVQILLNRSAVTGTNGLVNGVEWDVIIPPFSNFKLTAENKTDSTAYNAYGMLIAEAVGTIETGYQ